MSRQREVLTRKTTPRNEEERRRYWKIPRRLNRFPRVVRCSSAQLRRVVDASALSPTDPTQQVLEVVVRPFARRGSLLLLGESMISFERRSKAVREG